MSGQDEHLNKEKVRKALQRIVADVTKSLPFAWGSVKSVDKAKKTAVCADLDGGPDYIDVLLGLDSIIAVPATNATVLLGITSKEGEASFIVWASAIEEYFIETKTGFKFHLKDDGTATLNGNNLDGLAVVGKIAEKLNALEDAINQHIKEFNTHTHPVAGNATTPPVAPSNIQLQNTRRQDLENKKIKHGN